MVLTANRTWMILQVFQICQIYQSRRTERDGVNGPNGQSAPNRVVLVNLLECVSVMVDLNRVQGIQNLDLN